MGKRCLSWSMEKFALTVLYPLVRPFVLLFFGLTLTYSLAQVPDIEVGLDVTAVLPNVSISHIAVYYVLTLA